MLLSAPPANPKPTIASRCPTCNERVAGACAARSPSALPAACKDGEADGIIPAVTSDRGASVTRGCYEPAAAAAAAAGAVAAACACISRFAGPLQEERGPSTAASQREVSGPAADSEQHSEGPRRFGASARRKPVDSEQHSEGPYRGESAGPGPGS
jgi:hypothetical protein